MISLISIRKKEKRRKRNAHPSFGSERQKPWSVTVSVKEILPSSNEFIARYYTVARYASCASSSNFNDDEQIPSRGKVNRPRSSSVTTLPPTTRDLSPLLSQTSQSTISSGNKVACASDRVIASALNKLARPEDAGRRPRRDDRPEEGTKRKTTRNGVRVSTKFDNV